eukprot:1900725-Ditylum_brightwellii.AAC.1
MGPLLQHFSAVPNAPPFLFSDPRKSNLYRIFATTIDDTDGESGSSSSDETDDDDDDDDEGPGTINAAAPDPQIEQ